MKFKLPIGFFLGLTALTALGTSLHSAHAVTIVHSNDVLGELEPCGCRTNPLGGYPRKANLLKKQSDPALIQVDAGDLLFPSTVIPEMLKEQSEFQARYALKVLDRLHHDVVVPGEKDFALGTKTLLKLVAETKIHFLAANLLRKDGKPLFKDSMIFTKKDQATGKNVRVAILGLVGKDLEWPKDLKATDPIAAAKSRVPELRKKADYVIAVTHEGVDEDKLLAEKVRGIDFIIGGHTQSFLQVPVVAGKTTILQSSFRNQYVGLLDLSKYSTQPLQASGSTKKTVASPESPESQESKDTLSNGSTTGASQKPQDDSAYRLIGLDAGYDSPADAPGEIDQLVTEFKTKLAAMNVHADDVIPVSSTHGDKFQTFPRCAECHLKQFDFYRKTPHINALAALVKVKQDKNKECLSCHTVGLGDPSGVNAVTRLIQIKSENPIFLPNEEFVTYLESIRDAKTVQSEVKALARTPSAESSPAAKTEDAKALDGAAEGSLGAADTAVLKRPEKLSVQASLNQFEKAWTPVQCENCHGPGRDHPFAGAMAKKVETTTCLQCHTPARATDWYTKDGKPDWQVINAKHAQMACPSGEMNLDN